MKEEKTPEEAAKSKRAHANSMIVMGAVTTACGLAAAVIALSGRGAVPDWMFGGAPAARAVNGDWTNFPSKTAFEDWGPAPFARARKEGKLVLLFLGPSYNAPTARMLSETFGDPASAALADARFVPVRVKSEEFPDLDRRYRAGGWPTVALLLPDGVVLDAGASLAPGVFRRWAGAVADKAAAHPELLARADAEAAARRDASAAARGRSAAPPSAEDAAGRAEAALTAAWDPARRTFEKTGPRFPRFERIAALEKLTEPWAKALAVEAAKGALVLQDPRDGGFRRAANPDASPAALEKISADQAGALEALCSLAPDAARRELGFLDKEFSSKDAPDRWRGWLAGYALDAKRDAASDGANFERFRAEGWREVGRGRLGDDAELSRAVLSCAVATAAEKSRARKVLGRVDADFEKAARAHDPRLLLDDAVSVGAALLAAGKTGRAESVWKWMEANLGGGPAYLDRLPTGVLPPEADRLADPALNARALRFTRGLAAVLKGPEGAAASKRAQELYFWLSARPDALDPAVWAELAAEESR